MDLAGTLARIVLGAVFVAAAVMKLRDRPGAISGARSLGLTASLAPAVAVALPIVELAIALLLAVAPRFGASCAAALLVVFSAAIAAQLTQGKRPICHCFGAWSARPAGAPELVRNAALIALAGVVVLGS